MATIIFNGKTYNSVEEMPATERQAFEQLSTMFVDKNGNGIPDFLEGDMMKNVMTAYTNIVSMDGKTYNNMNELPADLQTKVQTAFEKMSELGIVTNQSTPMIARTSSMQVGQSPQVMSTPVQTTQEYPSAIQSGSGPSTLQWALLGIALFFCLLIAAATVIYFFMR